MSERLPIQRWTKIFTRYPASEILPNESGEYVTYADHLNVLSDCEERVLDAAREAVAALATERELRSPSGLEVDVHAALDAIDALRTKS